MSFLYFIPRVVNAAEYAELGLGYAFDAPPAVTLLNRDEGPEGLSGTVLHNWEGPSLPKGITWRKIGNDLWLGWHPEQRPNPLKLRKNLIIAAGIQLRLRDGQLWTIPRVLACRDRDPHRADALPRVLGIGGDDGEVAERVAPEFDLLMSQADRMLESYLGDRSEAVEFDELIDFLAELLAVSYRIGRREILALELFDKQTAEAACLDAIDALERIKAESPARITARLDELGVDSWLAFQALRIVGQEDDQPETGIGELAASVGHRE